MRCSLDRYLAVLFFLSVRQNPPPIRKVSQATMKLLNTYEDRDEAEAAADKLTGEKRLASERDATVVIYVSAP
jgi:hypothetical protein